MKKLFVRAAVVATSLALSTGALAPAHAGDPTRAEKADSWLLSQLTAGVVHNDQYSFDDLGLTVDFGLAFKAMADRPGVRLVKTAMAGQVNAYTTYDTSGPAPDYAPLGRHISGGSVAKLSVFAQQAGADITNFGGVNLKRRLKNRIAEVAPIRGRLNDKVTTADFEADFSNVIGQAYAVQALSKAGATKAAPALRYLLKQQCDAGYFRLNFTKSKTRLNQTCEGGSKVGISAPDTDTTAIVVLALDSLNSTDPKVKASIARAVTWLKAKQRANGAFGGGTTTEGANANSTGLAGWALAERGRCVAAQKAAVWLSRRQLTNTAGGLAVEAGAIAYDKAGFSLAISGDAITVDQRDQWRRATAQAAPALLNLTLADCTA